MSKSSEVKSVGRDLSPKNFVSVKDPARSFGERSRPSDYFTGERTNAVIFCWELSSIDIYVVQLLLLLRHLRELIPAADYTDLLQQIRSDLSAAFIPSNHWPGHT